MGTSVEETIKEIQGRENIFVAYSQTTKLPYVTCGEESFNDQAWFFTEEEAIKEFGKKKIEEKVLLMGMRYEKKDFPKMYDLSKVEPQKRPLINPTLQLSGIYFMQELRRPVPQEEHKNLRALEEEVIVNLRKSDFLVAMQRKGDEPDKVNIPYLKNKEGKILQPVFSDVMEFEKFAKGKKLRIAKVPFNKLPNILIEQAESLVINPMGFNLVLNRDQLKKIIG